MTNQEATTNNRGFYVSLILTLSSPVLGIVFAFIGVSLLGGGYQGDDAIGGAIIGGLFLGFLVFCASLTALIVFSIKNSREKKQESPSLKPLTVHKIYQATTAEPATHRVTPTKVSE